MLSYVPVTLLFGSPSQCIEESTHYLLQSMQSGSILLLTCELFQCYTLVCCVSFNCQCLLHVSKGALTFLHNASLLHQQGAQQCSIENTVG